MSMRLFFIAAAALGLSACGQSETETVRQHVNEATAFSNYPFSAAVIVGKTIYLSGEIGLMEDGKLAEGVGAQTAQIFKNYEKTLAGMGASLADIVKCTVFLDDMSDYGEMNAAYAAALPDPKPARSTFGVEGLAMGAALEIECLAIK